MAVMSRCGDEIAVSRRRTTPMSTNSVAKTAAALQPARRADANQVSHDEPEIEATRMNQEALQDIRVTAQMRATHPPVS